MKEVSAIAAVLDAVEQAEIQHTGVKSDMLQAARDELARGVEVKALVWEEISGFYDSFRAETPFPFAIVIDDYETHFSVEYTVKGYQGLWLKDMFKTSEDAKAAAQAHHDALIRGALV